MNPEGAQLDLDFALRGGQTVLDRRLFSWPFALTRTFYLDRQPAGMLSVILQTSSGAIQAGDRLLQKFHAHAGSAAHVTTQGATAVHRAPPGIVARESVLLRVEDGAYLEFLPDPKILFPASALTQNLELICAPGGIALVSDAFIGHDPDGAGRGFRHLQTQTVIRRQDGEPLLVDRMALGALPVARGERARFRAFGSLYVLLPADLVRCRQLHDGLTAAATGIDGLYAAASFLPNQLGVGLRLAAYDGMAIRHGLEAGWCAAREILTGLPPAPRRK